MKRLSAPVVGIILSMSFGGLVAFLVFYPEQLHSGWLLLSISAQSNLDLRRDHRQSDG